MKEDYWYYRKIASKLIPRQALILNNMDFYSLKEKGRKSNYKQYDIVNQNMNTMDRLLNTESINSFVEVSLRAQSCPMPLNIDVWDGLTCPYKCKYCFADYFRHSLYTSFFDNYKKIGLRHCKDSQWKSELDKLFIHRGEKVEGDNSVINAIRLNIPIRIGIRFEDFTLSEKKHGTSLHLLQYLARNKYPVMINTKSDLLSSDEYLQALVENNKAAIHITMISSNEGFIKKIEPGAPSFAKRIESARILSNNNIRVVARIEPWMIFLNDSKYWIDDYLGQLKDNGIKYLTLDSYSYSAYSKGLSKNFTELGYDFDRMFYLSSDSQWLSSLLLGKFIEYIRSKGFKASTFDQGNVPSNDDWICCSVGDHFSKYGFNWGSGVIAIKYIQSRKGEYVRWKDFNRFVLSKGGWLSSQLMKEVKLLWNGEGDSAWPIYWAQGIIPIGQDEDGVIWKYESNNDFRFDNLYKGGLL